MSGKWKDSTRRAELPPDWATIRALVANRAHDQCEATLPSGARCPRRGTDCHHAGGKHNHDWQAMQWLCAHHHAQQTAQEAIAAKRKTKHREPKHPGDRT